jgi:hypothetical protein
VTASVVVGLIGLFGVGSGSMGLSGRFLRTGSRTLMGNFSAQLVFGLALVGAAAVAALEEGSPAAALLSVPVAVLFVLGIWSLFRPPRWLQPAWQREIDDMDRRARR